MFSYCNNDPVMNIDPSGHIVISYNDIKNAGGVAKAIKVYGRSNNNEYLSNGAISKMLRAMITPDSDSWTASLGISVGWAAVTAGANMYDYWSFDSGQNHALQTAKSIQMGPGEGLSTGVSLMLTNAVTVYDLEGASVSYGGSIVVIKGLSIDYVTFTSPVSGQDHQGLVISIGVGQEVEFHISQSVTKTAVSWNIFRKCL